LWGSRSRRRLALKWVVTWVKFHGGRGNFTITSKNTDFGRIFAVKVDGWNGIRLAQGFPNRGMNDGPDGLFVFELHLGLGGMDIDVQCFRIHFQVQKERGLLTIRNQQFIGFHDGTAETLMFDKSVVDKEILHLIPLACCRRISDKAGNTNQLGLDVYRIQLLLKLPRIAFAENLEHTLSKIGRRQHVQGILIVCQR